MRGHITRGRNDGVWYIRVELSRGADGKRRQRRETVRGTKAEAQRRLREMLHQVETGAYVENGRITVAEIAKQWLAAKQHRVSSKTYGSYDGHVRLYIEPEIGSLKAESLRAMHIQAALVTWQTGTRHDREKGNVSARTVVHVHQTLRTMLRWAIKMGMLVRNVADSVEPPRFEQPEMKALNPEGVANLLEAAHGTELQAPIAVAIGTGLRRGELLGLRWSDIELDDARLMVRRSVETVKGVIRTKPPKTMRSARTIALPAFVVDVLRTERTRRAQSRLLLGLGRADDEWVFTREDGSQWEPGAFSLAFARFVKQAKLPHVRFHDLRHSFGTLALASGVDLQTVSRALGHESVAITSRIYVHAVRSLEEDAAKRIDTLLGETVAKAVGGSETSSVPQRCQIDLARKRKRPKNRALFGSANGNRTRLSALKGRCPNR